MGEVVRSEVSQARSAHSPTATSLSPRISFARIRRSTSFSATYSSWRWPGDEIDRREWAMCMTLVARALERIGDNAVDIGEQTVFVVTGLFKEFASRKP